jgi:tetratricopeptide (TPR) repeat protein
MQLYSRVLLAGEHINKDKETIEQLFYVHLEISHILLRLGKPQEQEIHLTQAFELAQMSKSTLLESMAFTFKTMNCLGSGNVEDSVELATHAYELAEKSNSDDVLLVSKSSLMHAYFFTGQFKKLYELGTSVVDNLPDLSYFPDFHRVPSGHLAYVNMFCAKSIEGDFISMKARQKEWLASTNLEEISTSAYFVSCGLGINLYYQGDYEKASFYLLTALRNAAELQNIMVLPLIASALACINLRRGKLAEGRKYLEQAIHVGKLVRFSFITVVSLSSICEGLLLLGEFEKAREFLNMAFDICKKRHIHWLTPSFLRVEAELDLHLSEPNYSQIEQKIQEALNLAQASELQAEIAHCHLALAKLYKKMGETESCREASNKALETYKKLDMPYWVSLFGAQDS